jgi:thioredoxin-related protein
MRLSTAVRWIALAWLVIAVPAPAAPAEAIAPATDLVADGAESARSGRPLVLLFTATWCEYCEAVKREYFVHAARDPAFTGRAILREVVIDSERPLIDFHHRRSTHAALADERGVDLVPAVHFVDHEGARLADPVIGRIIPDWYGAYIDRALGHAASALRRQPFGSG